MFSLFVFLDSKIGGVSNNKKFSRAGMIPQQWLCGLRIPTRKRSWTRIIAVAALLATVGAMQSSKPTQARSRTAPPATTSSVSTAARPPESGEELIHDILRRDVPSFGPFQKPDTWRRRIRRRVGTKSRDLLESVRTNRFRGGGAHDSSSSRYASSPTNNATNETKSSSNSLDAFLGKTAKLLGIKVAADSLATLLGDEDNGILEELTNRLLSPESANAVRTVRKIVRQFGEHGVVDVFSHYPSREVIVSIVALARLQGAAAYYEEKRGLPGKDVMDDKDLLSRLARYAVFANAAYGWTVDLALKGKFHRGDLQALLRQTGIRPEDVVAAHWNSKTLRPAYFIVRDQKQKKIVLCIRGTLSARDVLTDLCCNSEDFETGGDGLHRAHSGMLASARGVAESTKDIIAKELAAHPDYSLVLVGHSLGGGVAAVLGTLWEKDFEGLCVYGFGTPCVGPIAAKPASNQNVVSVVGQGDPFSCLSLGHVAAVTNSIAQLCEDAQLRSLVLIRTDGPLEEMDDFDLEWCFETMKELRSKFHGEKLYPPGRILYLSEEDIEEGVGLSLREVPHTLFQDLRLQARMLDISRHVPSVYEKLLQDMHTKTP